MGGPVFVNGLAGTNTEGLIVKIVHRMIDMDLGGADDKVNGLIVRTELAFQLGTTPAKLAPAMPYIKGIIDTAVASHSQNVRLSSRRDSMKLPYTQTAPVTAPPQQMSSVLAAAEMKRRMHTSPADQLESMKAVMRHHNMLPRPASMAPTPDLHPALRTAKIASAQAALRPSLHIDRPAVCTSSHAISHAPSSALGNQLRVGSLADKGVKRVTFKAPHRDDDSDSVVAQPSSSAGLSNGTRLDRIRAGLMQAGGSAAIIDKLIHTARQDGFDQAETIRKAKARAASQDRQRILLC